MTRFAAVQGVGIAPFERKSACSLSELAARAIDEALRAAGCEAKDIEEIFVGNALGSQGVVARLAQDLGFTGLPVTRIEQACASGSTALRLASQSVESERCGLTMALGVDKMAPGLLEIGDSEDYATRLALNLLPVRYALKTAQYMHEFGVTIEEIATVSVSAKRLASTAPHAAYGGVFTPADVAGSGQVADPLTKLHCCGNADGAAAAVIGPASTGPEVRVLAWSAGSSVPDPGLDARGGWDNLEDTVEKLSGRLYEEVGHGPNDFDLIQINDAFSVAAPLYLEALGLAERGEAMKLIQSGETLPGGTLPVNTDGGLLGRGHCLGATGLAMLYEIWTQMRGEASDRQVRLPVRRALLQSHGLGGDNIVALEWHRGA